MIERSKKDFRNDSRAKSFFSKSEGENRKGYYP
jgi:hypothetical protein